jgi:hypothetical protein
MATEVLKYTPIPNDVDGAFRLVTLEPASSDSEPLRCKLTHEAWSNPDRPYEALSYVWGDSVIRKTISIDGSDFEITNNLYVALCHLRQQDKARLLWVDAICINQRDIAERNREVRNMGTIYERAENVVVWLGPEADQSQTAIEFIVSFCINLDTHGINQRNDIAVVQTSLSQLRQIVRPFAQQRYLPLWMSVVKLLQRPWFERAWVFQELVSGTNAIVQCGKKTMSWRPCYTMIRAMATSEDIGALLMGKVGNALTDANLLFWSRGSRLLWEQDPTKAKYSRKLLFLISQQRERLCQDPRDKIYSVLGLTDEAVQKAIIPDYGRSVEWVYCQLVKAYVEIYKDLEIMCHSMHVTASSCPSWAPDWRFPNNRCSIGGFPEQVSFRASRRQPAAASFSEDLSTIKVKGFCIGTVRDRNVQKAARPFLYRIGANNEIFCNWDIQVMARKLSEVPNIVTRASDRAILEIDFEALALHELKPKESTPPTASPAQETVLEAVLYSLVSDREITNKDTRKLVLNLVEDPTTLTKWPQDRAGYFKQANSRTWSMTVVLSDSGYIGLAPMQTNVDDLVYALQGCSAPIILRKRGDGAFSWVGDAYIHGVCVTSINE